MDDAPQIFATLLRRHRQAAGLTQEGLAERAGIGWRTISDLERGVKHMPRADTLALLAEALDLDASGRQVFEAAARGLGTSLNSASGEPPTAVGTPAGTRTFMIADVRGYTRFTHERGDAAGAALAIRFAELAHAAVSAHGGRVVEVRGDEVMAVFAEGRQALRAAVDLQERCRASTTPDLPLNAGVGMDVGEPISVGNGFRGEVINVAARLCALAGPGEVLASDSLIHLARRIEGLAYVSRGEVTLKGLSAPVRVSAVYEEGLTPPAQPVPPAAETAARAVPHNLPAPFTSFIGRERELEQIAALLREGRLVTLIGTGGAGKTRLSLEVAGMLARMPSDVAGFPPVDAVWQVELAALRDGSLVAGAVAQAAGLREEAANGGTPGRAPLAALVAGLREERLLLVLDNCEHLIDACAEMVHAVLRSCPGVRVLATSREPLGVPGEKVFRVPSLPVPNLNHLPAPFEMIEIGSVRLFLARARDRRPDFELTAENARAVGEICARLDGIPLALELAAVRVGTMPVEVVASRLDDRFRLLSSGPRTVMARQQTLRAALEWSFDLLSGQEQALLCRLAVFSGGWTTEAAEQVCAAGDLDSWEIADLLGGLVNKSLVVPPEQEQGVRYRLLETVRQFGEDCSRQAGAVALPSDRHFAYFHALARDADAELTGPAQETWLARLEVEHDNFRAALAWALSDAAHGAAGLDLAALLWRFWYQHGHLREGRSWLERGLAAAPSADPVLIARAQNGAGNLARAQNDNQGAMAWYEQSLQLRRALGDAKGVAASLANMGTVAWIAMDYERARSLIEESLTLYRGLGDAWGTAAALGNLAGVTAAQGLHSLARAAYEETIVLFKQLGDRWGEASALVGLGGIASQLGEFPRAMGLLEQGLLLYRQLGDVGLMAWSLEEMAQALSRQALHERAAFLFGAAASLRKEVGSPLGDRHRIDHDLAIDVTAAELGTDKFDAVFTRGHGASRDDAVAAALDASSRTAAARPVR